MRGWLPEPYIEVQGATPSQGSGIVGVQDKCGGACMAGDAAREPASQDYGSHGGIRAEGGPRACGG